MLTFTVLHVCNTRERYTPTSREMHFVGSIECEAIDSRRSVFTRQNVQYSVHEILQTLIIELALILITLFAII